MFLKNLLKWLEKFWGHNFSGTFGSWGTREVEKVESLNWDFIGDWLVFFAIFTALLTLILCKSRLIEKLSKHILSMSLIIWLAGVIVYIVGFYSPTVNGVSVILRAIVSSFKMFVVANDLARVPALLQNDPSYMSAFALLHFSAAFISFLFIFKMIGYKIKSSIRLKLHKLFRAKKKIVHLFWGVNEASILLAEDIRRHHEADTIIFVDIDEECEDNTKRKATLSHITNTITIKNSEIYRLEAINALVDHCYNGPAAFKGEGETDIFNSLNLKTIGCIVRKSSKSNFYFLSDNETQNIVGALNLQKDKQLLSMGANKPDIYVHARRDANNEIFDHYSQYDGESQRMKIKIVDSAYLSVITLKQDKETLPVNCVKIDPTTSLVDSTFTALIVGFGATGQEAFKYMYEYSAFVDTNKKKSPFRCYAIDEKMNKIAGLIREKMPDIGEDELSLVHATIDSEEYWKTIKRTIKDLNYVVITLNNDALGLSLAVNIFKYALQHHPSDQPMLKILVRCYDNSNEKRMTEVANNLNKSIENKNIEIRLFGQEKKLYSYKTILSNATLHEAMEFNKVYENSELSAQGQWQKNFGEDEIIRLMTKEKMSRYHAIYDINLRISQNISNSLHGQTKLILMGLDEKELSEKLSSYYAYVNSRADFSTKYECSKEVQEILINIAIVEHERWIAAHKLMGYKYNPDNDYVKKHHKYICSWDDLDEMIQSYDCNVVDTTIKMLYKSLEK